MSSTALTEPQPELALSSRQVNDWPEGIDLAGLLRDWWHLDRPASFSMPPLERAVPICRQLSRLWLDAQHVHHEDARHTVLVLVSELTTNAILHSASARITNRLWRAGDEISVEVRDQRQAPASPRIVRPREAEPHGRGLSIVHQYATRWGVSRDTSECAVWATVDLPKSTGRRPA